MTTQYDNARPDALREIRNQLGCDLRSAADLYENHRGDWRDYVLRLKLSGVSYESPLEKVRDSIRGYYDALKRNEPELDAMRNTLEKIQRALGMFDNPEQHVCRMCNVHIKLVENNQWHSDPPTVLPQYCWVDPVHGSQLHVPYTHQEKQ